MKTCITTIDWISMGYDELTPADRQLVDAAKDATSGSHSPYSGFSVGAAVLLDNGRTVTGSNQENAAYPSGLCAERTALFSAGHMYPGMAVTALAIAARNKDSFTAMPVTPCGACRQVMAEFESISGRPIRFLFYGTESVMLVEGGVKSLLPFCFVAESME